MRPALLSLLRPVLLALCLGRGLAAAQGPPQAEEPPQAQEAPFQEPPAPAPPESQEAQPPAPAPDDSTAAPAEPPAPAEAQPAPNPDQVFSGHPVPQPEEHSWFDAGRSYVGRLFFAPVVRIDRFFSDLTELDPDRARSFARLRSGIRFRQDGKPVESLDLIADIHFPGVNRWLDRFRLVLAGAADSVVEGLYSSYGSSAPFSFRDETRTGNLELRFGAYQGIRSSVDLGTGILFQLPAGAFVRARYRLAVPIYDRLVGRTSTSVFWRTDTHFGTRLDGALELPADPSTMVRLAASSTLAQRKTNGVDYGAELAVSHAFTPTSAVAFGVDGVGSTGSPVGFEKYRLFTRVRHDVLRRWIFLEVEPEVGWPWTPERGRYQALAITFRLELQIEGAGAADLAVRDRAPSATSPLSPP